MPPVKQKYRRRCRFCNKLFETNFKDKRTCSPRHRWLLWAERNPRIRRSPETVKKLRAKKK